MISSSSIRAGRAHVETSLDNRGLVNGLGMMSRQLTSWRDKVNRMFGRGGGGGGGMRGGMLSGLLGGGLGAGSVGGMGGGMLLGGAGAGGLAFQFASFEKAMLNVKAMTEATGRQFDALKQKARELGRTTVHSAQQIAEGMAVLAKAGFTPEQIGEAIGPTQLLAAAADLDMQTAADMTTKIMAGMQLQTKDLTRMIDVMARTASKTQTEIVELGDAMAYFGPIASLAGVSMEEAVAAIGLLSQRGIVGEMAGTGLRGVFLDFADPEKMAKLGVQVKDVNGDFLTLAQIIGQIERKFADLGSAEMLQQIGGVFDARRAQTIAALVSIGSGQIEKATQANRASGGTALEQADTKLSGFYGKAQLLWSAIMDLSIEFFETIQGDLIQLMDWGIATSLWMKEWITNNRGVVIGLERIVLGFGATATALVSLGAVLAFLTTNINWVIAGISALQKALWELGQMAGLLAADKEADAVRPAEEVLLDKDGNRIGVFVPGAGGQPGRTIMDPVIPAPPDFAGAFGPDGLGGLGLDAEFDPDLAMDIKTQASSSTQRINTALDARSSEGLTAIIDALSGRNSADPDAAHKAEVEDQLANIERNTRAANVVLGTTGGFRNTV